MKSALCPLVGLFCSLAAVAPGETLQVGTKEAPPFALQSPDGEWRGLAIDLWKEVSEELGYEIVFQERTLPEMLAGVESGELDVAVGALTISAQREQAMDFSHPFFSTGLGIATPAREQPGWLQVLLGFFSFDFLKAILALVAVLLAAGAAVWLFERKRNPEQFGGVPRKGLGESFWWSAVTMTTVGYGDKAPVTLGGRVVALIWMFLSIIIISGFTASIASSLTVRQFDSAIRGPQDLGRFAVATVAASTSESYLREKGVRFRAFATLEEAMEAVGEGEADCAVFDAPMLRYLVQESFAGQLKVLPQTFYRQDYGFALAAGSVRREEVNSVLLDRIAGPWWAGVQERYLGGE
ncbi:MAG: transporter substrate-binding domain-containing protein [Verrucomicrobiota bacterium]